MNTKATRNRQNDLVIYYSWVSVNTKAARNRQHDLVIYCSWVSMSTKAIRNWQNDLVIYLLFMGISDYKSNQKLAERPGDLLLMECQRVKETPGK